MKRTLFTLLLLFFNSTAFSQTFAYSFEGSLSGENIQSFESEFNSIVGIQTFELRIKPDQQRGELIFSIVEPVKKDESDLSFSPVDVKQLLIKYNLNPLDFRQVK